MMLPLRALFRACVCSREGMFFRIYEFAVGREYVWQGGDVFRAQARV